MRIEDLETPALLLDLPAMEANLAKMKAWLRTAPAKLRPHFKNHRILALADEQIAAGAAGITCARLWQAELLVKHGIKDVLIANEIAGPGMIRQFVELSRRAPVIVAVDCAVIVEQLGEAAGPDRGLLNVLVDIDLGLKRCGVATPEAAMELSKKVVASGLRFRGLMGYEGHLQPQIPGPEKDRSIREALSKLIEAKKLVEQAGIPAEIVSCGGTGDYTISGTYPGVTEVQAGSYLFMDSWYVPYAPDFQPALSVLCTVVSKTEGQRIVVDAGCKAISGERGLPPIVGCSSLKVKALHAEHAPLEIVEPDAGKAIKVGDRLRIRVQYHDGTIQLHRQMFGVRDSVVERVLRIEHTEWN